MDLNRIVVRQVKSKDIDSYLDAKIFKQQRSVYLTSAWINSYSIFVGDIFIIEYSEDGKIQLILMAERKSFFGISYAVLCKDRYADYTTLADQGNYYLTSINHWELFSAITEKMGVHFVLFNNLLIDKATSLNMDCCSGYLFLLKKEASYYYDCNKVIPPDSYFNQSQKKKGKDLIRLRKKIQDGMKYVTKDLSMVSKEEFCQYLKFKKENLDSRNVNSQKIDSLFLFLQRLKTESHVDFKILFQALMNENTIMAAHIGIMHNKTFFYLWPTYDVLYNKYSIGLILLEDIIKDLTDSGVAKIDFGNGNEKYKQWFNNGENYNISGFYSPNTLAGKFFYKCVSILFSCSKMQKLLKNIL